MPFELDTSPPWSVLPSPAAVGVGGTRRTRIKVPSTSLSACLEVPRNHGGTPAVASQRPASRSRATYATASLQAEQSHLRGTPLLGVRRRKLPPGAPALSFRKDLSRANSPEY